jgi:hypothetical protein
MYPLVKWGRQAVIERLTRLVDNQLEIEAVVAEFQTIERMVKRVIVARRLKTWPGGLNASTAKAARDWRRGLYRAHGHERLAKEWAVAFGGPSLSEVVDRHCGKQAWEALVLRLDKASAPQRFPAFFGEVAIRRGLFATRHAIVHDGFSPAAGEINGNARFGLEVVRALSDAFDGSEWPDPFKRLPQIPKDK